MLSRRIPIRTAFLIYLGFMLLVYWPVLLEKRFFWEDFFIQEYPIRDFCYYASGVKHLIPFWNPYTWSMPSFLADAQCGFWYPGNLLQIAFAKIFSPNALHIPEIIPEFVTILHLPFAALGLFYLLRTEYKISDIAALVAGLTFGFGTRIVADQNHPMFIYQLSLLPWEMLLLMRSWKSWRSAIGFGILFGISYLAGQPQVFLFLGFFFACFTIAETISRWNESRSIGKSIRPISVMALGLAFTIGICCIQFLPTLELVSRSARAHISYEEAASFGLHPAGLLMFIVPRIFPELTGILGEPPYHVQPTFYWSALAEILALFAIIALWHSHQKDVRTRHLRFFVIFTIFAIAFAFGKFLPVHWFFWKFIPFFDKVRAPARMLWVVWFIGTLFGGIGFDLLIRDPDGSRKYRKVFLCCSVIFLTANVIVLLGIPDSFMYGKVREHIVTLILPSLIVSVLLACFFFFFLRKRFSQTMMMVFAAMLIIGELYYLDFTQHQNTVSREKLAMDDSANPVIRSFFEVHNHDHAKLLWLHAPQTYGRKVNLGMILRLPIEDAIDTNTLTDLNKMRTLYAFPPDTNRTRRMEIMGISGVLDENDSLIQYPQAIPFLKLYHEWHVLAPNDKSVYEDSSFDFRRTIVLNDSFAQDPSASFPSDTAFLSEFSENELTMILRTHERAILLINDLYDPSWQCRIDDNSTKILRAFSCLRAVPVPAGNHTIKLHFRNTAFEVGWKISAITLILGAICMITFRREKKNKNLS